MNKDELDHIYRHSDPKKGQFSLTSLEDYMSCSRLYWYKKPIGLTPIIKPLSLVFGGCVHAGVGEWYLNAEDDFDTRKEKVFRAFCKEWEEFGDPEGDGVRSLEIGLDILDNYCKTYKDDKDVYLNEFIETPASIVMPNGTELFFRIDRLRSLGNDYTVVDTKTSKAYLTDWFWVKFKNSFQLIGYAYAVNKLLDGDWDSVQVDAIKVPRPAKKDTLALDRREFYITDIQFAEFENTYCKVTDQIMKGLELPEDEQALYFHQVMTSCDKYGGCSFIELCQFGFDNVSVGSMFERRSG